MIESNQNKNGNNSIVFDPRNPSQFIKNALNMTSAPSAPSAPSVPSVPSVQNGKFVANAIISKTYTNKEGEIKGGNNVGFQVSFSNIDILDHDMRMKLEDENKNFLYHWTAFETIATSVQNLTPTNIGKALNDLLADEFGKTPKNGGDKKLSVNQKNKYINGFYSSINKLKHIIDMKRKLIEEEQNLIPTGFIVKDNGESKMTYQRMRKVTTPKARVKKSESRIKSLEAENAELLARLEALESKN